MAKAPQGAPIPGPAFIRLIARLADARLSGTGPALADRLSEWIDWTRAVSLSKALDGRLPAADAGTPVFGADDELECARVRAALVHAISADVDPTATRQRRTTRGTEPVLDGEPGYTLFRERYRDLQQSMQAETGRLRGRLRDMLAAGSPGQARLAEVDAVMEMTLIPREHALLGSVPALLEQHFDRLRHPDADAETLVASQDPTDATPGLRVSRFHQDMRHVLLAELDLRFQPIEGLLAALRTR